MNLPHRASEASGRVGLVGLVKTTELGWDYLYLQLG